MSRAACSRWWRTCSPWRRSMLISCSWTSKKLILKTCLVSEITRLRTVSSLQITCRAATCAGARRRASATQVFRNVLDNAARHAKSVINVGCSAAPARWWFGRQ